MTLFVFSVVFVLIVTALCSLAEAALYAVRTPYVRKLRESGSRAGEILSRFKLNMERPITALLILNTAATGVVAFLVHRRHGAIPENVVANARRRAQRDSVNAGVRARNADRIAATVLLVSPAAGEGAGP